MLIKEIKLLTSDLAATKNFYNQILELEIVFEEDIFISFQAGFALLTFREVKEKKPVYHFAFNIPCNKIEEAFYWVESKTEIIKTDGENKIVDFKNWNAKAVYFLDNNGNILELIARLDIENEDNPEFNSNSILSISEMAIVTDSVMKTANNLIQSLNISFFDKQPPSEEFAALGDDNGLLILSKAGRNWFLTDLPSKKHWQSIIFETDGKQKEITFNE
jgi:catechol 2,3-dioxygenase-like lactoylglutathione lyase family enzyme